jgi:hypothetical protein
MRLLFVAGLLMVALRLEAQHVVHETAAQWNAARVLSLTAERRWCADANAAGCDFKSPATVRALPDGGILVSDVSGPLRRFGSTGAFIGALGRRGQGPGEYGFVVDAQLASNGLVTWFDNTQMRMATVRLDGSAGPVTRVMPPFTMANLFLVDTQLVIFDVPAGAHLGDTVQGVYRTVPVSGTPMVFARVRTPAVFVAGSEGMMPMRAPFQPYVIGHVGSGGDVAHTNGARYDVEMFPRGAPAWRLTVDAPVRAVSQADRDSAEQQLLKAFKVTAVAGLPPNVRASFQRAGAVHPPLTALCVMRDGTVWTRPTPPAGASRARWDVFARDGKRVGQVLLPQTARVWDGARDWMLVSELDADEVATFVRYRVRP